MTDDVAALRERLERLEGQRAAERLATGRLPSHSDRPPSAFQQAMDEAQARARAERHQRAQEAAEAARRQAAKNAGLIGQLERELASLDKELDTARSASLAAQANADKLWAARVRLAARVGRLRAGATP